MNPMWANDRITAWTLEDGTLVVKTRVEDKDHKVQSEFDHYFIVDTLSAVKAEAA